MGYYRFLNHDQVTLGVLTQSLAHHCQQQVEGLHVLAISDTSEINLQAHLGRLQPAGLGLVGNHRDWGFFIHPTLVLNAADGFPLGVSHVHQWNRTGGASEPPRDYKTLPIEEKESVKWLEAATESQVCLDRGGAVRVTHLADREGDIYEAWVEIPDRDVHLLIRAAQDRPLEGTTTTLFRYLGEQAWQGTYTFQVLADPRTGRTERLAWMVVRFTPVELKRPKRLRGTKYPASVQIYAVEARELQPPPGQAPVHWRLLTTHPVVSLELALQVIRWYTWRWRIEQLFAVLKQGGLNLEATQLESPTAIQRLCVLALSAAVRVLQLTLGRQDETQTADLVFSKPELQCLADLAPTLQGRTRKQQNPHPPLTLAWATWLIARLGGGRDSRANVLLASAPCFRG